jgi:hypothetical protein
MAAKNKKKKLSPEERHRQLQDQVAALPYALADLEARGEKRKAFLTRYLAAPIIRLMKRLMDRQRYTGPEGQKLKQGEQMKRHLEQRRKAMEYMQGEQARQQKRASKRNRTR